MIFGGSQSSVSTSDDELGNHKKELYKRVEIHSAESEITELRKAVEHSSFRESTLQAENERLQKKIEELELETKTTSSVNAGQKVSLEAAVAGLEHQLEVSRREYEDTLGKKEEEIQNLRTKLEDSERKCEVRDIKKEVHDI